MLSSTLKGFRILPFLITTAKAALELHITLQPLLAGEDKVQHSTFSHEFLHYLEEVAIINAFQETPLFLAHCCAVPPTVARLVQVPYEDHVL